MKLLHPYMPFITEEIWQCLPHEGDSIMVAAWPESDEQLFDAEAESAMNAIMEAIKASDGPNVLKAVYAHINFGKSQLYL